MTIKKLLLGAVIGVGTLAATAGGASAAVACNRSGDCWHTDSHYTYRPTFGITVHDNNWRWTNRDHYRWREHTGRGYWRNGLWITF